MNVFRAFATSVLAGSLLIAAGCNADGTKSKEKTGTSSTAQKPEEPSGSKPEPIGKSGDQANQDSPDAQFYAEEYVVDL